MRYRRLDAGAITTTLGRLRARIDERFPGSGLSRVCADMVAVANTTADHVEALDRPYVALRAGVFALLISGLAAQLYAAVWYVRIDIGTNASALVAATESALNVLLLFGGGAWFLITLEERFKRSRVLAALHELRSLAHVVDMHQLTKDPTLVLRRQDTDTSSSPVREMDEFQLTRYLDYCAEMLALIGKLAALYAERSRDTAVIEAVNDLESLTTNLSRKIWQKIAIVGQLQADPRLRLGSG